MPAAAGTNEGLVRCRRARATARSPTGTRWRPCVRESCATAGSSVAPGERNASFRVPPIGFPYPDPNKTVSAAARHAAHMLW